MQFKELNIIPDILKALEDEKYEVPTPIQEKAIPFVLSGRDVLGCAQTGTGKTAAFAIPTIQLLTEEKVSYTKKRKIKALVITPTRELALQIYESFCTYGKYTKLKYCVIFGGISQKPQELKLRQGVDVLIATPGRLKDLMNQNIVDLKYVKLFILDEADRMLDMGFIDDVKKIIATMPEERQTLFFSATMPAEVAKLSSKILDNPAKIKIASKSSTVDIIDQYLYYVDKHNKKDLLVHLLKDELIASALVFTRTKHGADRLVLQLSKENVIAKAIHADKSQGARQSALNDFKSKKIRVLVATDIAARGIDIDELSHVFNFDMPSDPETYVHRIGRTGRAGLGGVSISFCDVDEKNQLAEIEKLIRKHLKEVKDHPFPLMNNVPTVVPTKTRRNVSKETDSNPSKRRYGSKKISAYDNKRKDASKKTTSYAGKKKITSKSAMSPNKKYQMTADGTLREKPKYTKFTKKDKSDKKDSTYSKKKNYKG
ncbi:MAG: DEAD/DEAH box helicase [Lachnotalea sp.]